MQVVFAVLAQSVSIDLLTNRLSLFNVIEGVQASHFPTILSDLVFAAVLRREPNDEVRFDSTLTARMGQTLIAQANLAVDFEDKPNTRLIARFQGLPLVAPGTLEFNLVIPNGPTIRVRWKQFKIQRFGTQRLSLRQLLLNGNGASCCESFRNGQIRVRMALQLSPSGELLLHPSFPPASRS
jgi:hypothetical protein